MEDIDSSVPISTKPSMRDDKLRLSLTIDEQDYDIRSEAGASSDGEGDKKSASRHAPASAGVCDAGVTGSTAGAAAGIAKLEGGQIPVKHDGGGDVVSTEVNAGSDGDDTNRKRRHSQISPIKWTSSDADITTDVKKPKAEKTEAEIERDSKLKYIFRSARFFIIKSNNYENVALSKARGIWSTMPQNEARLNQAFRQCCNVILIFSIRESGKFQGYARLASESDKNHPPVRWVLPPRFDPRILSGVFKLDWINRRDLGFGECSHLKNPWNDGKPVKVGRDGQEIEPTVGEALCRLFPLDENIDLRRIAQIARQSLKRRDGTSRPAAASSSTSSLGMVRSLSDGTAAAASASSVNESTSSRVETHITTRDSRTSDVRRTQRYDSQPSHPGRDRQDDYRRDHDDGRPPRYGGVKRETLLNGSDVMFQSYSDYVREFHLAPVIPPPPPEYMMASYAAAYMSTPMPYPYPPPPPPPPPVYAASVKYAPSTASYTASSRSAYSDRQSYERYVEDFLRGTTTSSYAQHRSSGEHRHEHRRDDR
jgi:hypothetical protein